jgi:ATP-dependent protease Clp ATPase subunit
VFGRRRLACSFCHKSDAQVAKLVAGPRVYICDQCAAEVTRIMEQSTGNEAKPSAPSLFRRLRERIGWTHHPKQCAASC